MANLTSKHILNTSANLLGFCLFVITSMHMGSTIKTHFVDVVTSIVAVLLTCSCVLSFISIRTQRPKAELYLETIADYLFILSLIGILVIILMVTFEFIKIR